VSGGATARDEVLARIRGALGAGVVAPEVPRAYRRAGTTGEPGSPEIVARFCERVAEYRATVTRIAAADLAQTVAQLCRERGARRIAVPPNRPDLGSGVEAVVDDPPLSPQALDQLDGVLTGCALAIAETGTIVLDGGERSGRRALTLVPDWHLCVVEAGSVVAGVPDAVAALVDAPREGRPITLVSGPSATSDIELDRVEGVHGPRTLDVLVLD
jgi:L-lactate dehydrogenase complex protein LldG